MKKTNLLLAAAFSMALGSIAMNASACSQVCHLENAMSLE